MAKPPKDEGKAREKADKEIKSNKDLKKTLRDSAKKDPKAHRDKWGL